jgi:hypothetical protein
MIACPRCHDDRQALRAWQSKGGAMPHLTCSGHEVLCAGGCGRQLARALVADIAWLCDVCWEERERLRVIPILKGKSS